MIPMNKDIDKMMIMDYEVYINKIGDTVILAPKKKLAEIFLKGAAMLDDDFLSDGVPESIDSKREEL